MYVTPLSVSHIAYVSRISITNLLPSGDDRQRYRPPRGETAADGGDLKALPAFGDYSSWVTRHLVYHITKVCCMYVYYYIIYSVCVLYILYVYMYVCIYSVSTLLPPPPSPTQLQLQFKVNSISISILSHHVLFMYPLCTSSCIRLSVC
jgi:hypothetical protein